MYYLKPPASFWQRKLFSAVIMKILLIFTVIAVRQKQLLWIKKVFLCILLQYTKHPKIAQFMRDNFMEQKKHIIRRNVLWALTERVQEQVSYLIHKRPCGCNLRCSCCDTLWAKWDRRFLYGNDSRKDSQADWRYRNLKCNAHGADRWYTCRCCKRQFYGYTWPYNYYIRLQASGKRYGR